MRTFSSPTRRPPRASRVGRRTARTRDPAHWAEQAAGAVRVRGTGSPLRPQPRAPRPNPTEIMDVSIRFGRLEGRTPP